MAVSTRSSARLDLGNGKVLDLPTYSAPSPAVRQLVAVAADGNSLEQVAIGAFAADGQTQITPETAIVLDEATGNEIALDLSASVNKATSGNYTLLYADVTETSAPGTDDKLIDLHVGGSEVFSVNNAGKLVLDAAQTFGTGTGLWFGDGNTGFYESSDNTLRMLVAGDGFCNFVTNRMEAFGNVAFALVDEAVSFSNPVVIPRSDSLSTGMGANSAGEISLICTSTEMQRLNRGESNAFLHLYNDHATGGTNYERLEIKGQTADNFRIQTAAGGTGTARDIEIDSNVILNPSMTYGAGNGIYFGDGDSGFHEYQDDGVVLHAKGTDVMFFNTTGLFGSVHNNAGGIRNAAATATLPTLLPLRVHTDSGIGGNSSDEISFISTSTEIGRVNRGESNAFLHLYNDHATGGTNYERLEVTGQTAGNFLIKTAEGGTGVIRDIEINIGSTAAVKIDPALILDPDATYDNTLGIRFGDADSGFYETSDDTITVLIEESDRFRFTANEFKGASSNAGAVYDASASATVPTLAPRASSSTTGIGANAANEISVINSAAETARFDSDATAGNTRFMIYDVDNATLERVSVGAADSGGSGFKVLRIPN